MRGLGPRKYLSQLALVVIPLVVCLLGPPPAFALLEGNLAADAGKDFKNRRDPFRPPNLVPVSNRKTLPLSPLEKYEVGQLKLVGVVWQLSRPRAMVEDEAGLGFIVKVGTRIGRHGGVVKKIEPGKVTIEEIAINFYGEREARQVEMRIAEEEGR